MLLVVGGHLLYIKLGIKSQEDSQLVYGDKVQLLPDNGGQVIGN